MEKNTLVYHGSSKDVAQWVVDSYADREDYKNNKSVQEWVEASRKILDTPIKK